MSGLKLFAIIWTAFFLLALIPVIRFDNSQRIRRIWAELSEETRNIGEAFVAIGVAANDASYSLRKLKIAKTAQIKADRVRGLSD